MTREEQLKARCAAVQDQVLANDLAMMDTIKRIALHGPTPGDERDVMVVRAVFLARLGVLHTALADRGDL